MSSNTRPSDANDVDGSTDSSNVRLMLHCPHGVVPYLTPQLLRRSFPASQVADILSLGLAVRDTCVVPFFDNQNDNKKKRKRKNNDNNTTTNKNDRSYKTPRGYTVSGTIQPDPWLLPYHRVTVPSFDLLQDASLAAAKHHHKKQSSSQVDENQKQQQQQLATKHHVHLWTPNGRLSLSPAGYLASMASLASDTYVCLYDMILHKGPPNRNNASETQRILEQKQHDKHAVAAVVRTQTWWTATTTTAGHEQQPTPKNGSENTDKSKEKLEAATAVAPQRSRKFQNCWMPLLVDPSASDSTTGITDDSNGRKHSTSTAIPAAPKSTLQSQLDWILQQQQQQQSNIQGVALIGWHYVSDATVRQQHLHTVLQHCLFAAATTPSSLQPQHATKSKPVLAVLATRSLHQIWEVASAAAAGSAADDKNSCCRPQLVIGTNLPASWAQEKKALVIDHWPFSLETKSTTPKNDASSQEQPCTASTHSSSSMLDDNGCISLLPPIASNTSSGEAGNNNQQQQQKHAWFEDTNPLFQGCSCWVCQTHSRAYIHHLVCAQELTAEILLFIHNLHHLLQLLRHFQDSSSK